MEYIKRFDAFGVPLQPFLLRNPQLNGCSDKWPKTQQIFGQKYSDKYQTYCGATVTLIIVALLLLFMIARIQLILTGIPLSYYTLTEASSKAKIDANLFKIGLYDRISESLIPIDKYNDTYGTF